MNRRGEKIATLVLQVNLSPKLTVCSCVTNDNQITLSLVREEKRITGAIYSEETTKSLRPS